MTPEEAFKIVTRGLASQGWVKSQDLIGVTPVCRLRSSHRRKCALGWLIPDEVYTPEMEDGEVEWPIPDLPQAFIEELRRAHDHSFSERDMWSCFRRIAKHRQFEFNLPSPTMEW